MTHIHIPSEGAKIPAILSAAAPGPSVFLT